MADTFTLQIIAPDREFYVGEATMVELRTTEGEIGVLKGHIPVTAVIAPGLVRIHEDGGEIKIAALHAGFIEILKDKVTILAEVVEWPDEIDEKRAEEARIRAERRLADHADGTNIPRAELALKRAIARIEAARK